MRCRFYCVVVNVFAISSVVDSEESKITARSLSFELDVIHKFNNVVITIKVALK